MDLAYKLYPYPVLGEVYDDYKTSKFESELIGFDKDGKEVIIKVKCRTDNPELLKLFEEGKVKYTVHIECSQTSYREIVQSVDGYIEHRIKDECLLGKVQICMFITATDSINGYNSLDFNDEYEDAAFDIEKGHILAIGNQFDARVEKEKDDLGKIPSIFSILPNVKDNEEMSLELSGDKVKIYLCKKDYDNYKRIGQSYKLQPACHSMIILPILVHIFDLLKASDFDDFEDNRWFRALRKALKNNNIDLTKDNLNNISSITLAQKVLNNPLSRALNNLVTDDEVEGDEE